MRSRLLAFTALAALTGLSACDSLGGFSAVTTNGQAAPGYRENDYANAGTNRDMWVVVLGAVPGSDAAALQQKTVATMQQNAGIKTRFTTQPQNYKSEYKTVLLFNGADSVRSNDLCANPGAQSATSPAATDLRVHAVFCRYDQFLTEVYASARGGNSLGNPNFEALIRQTMTGLYNANSDRQRPEIGDM
jgi:hypothetical protein